MTQLLLRILRAVTVTALVWSPASVALAKKSPLKDEGAGPSKQDRVDYFACRKGAMAIAKDQSNPNREQETKRALSLCKEQFPSVAAFSDCKRDAIRANKNNRQGFEAALTQCR